MKTTTTDNDPMDKMDASQAQRFHRSQWATLLALMFCYLFYYLGRHNYGWAFPYMEAELGLTYTQLGTFSMVLLLCYGIGQFINGNLGDKFGGRKMMAIGGLSSVVFNWITSFATSFGSLLLPWAFNGYSQSMGWAPGSRMLSNWWQHADRGKAFGFYVFSAGCSGVLVFAICGGINMLVQPSPLELTMMSVESRDEIPAAGVGIVFVAKDAEEQLHFRIFETDGALLADASEQDVTVRGERLEALRNRLANLWDADEVTPSQARNIGREVTALTEVVRTGLLSWRAFFRLPVLLLAGGAIVFYVVARNKPEDCGYPPIEDDSDHADPALTSGHHETSLQRYGLWCGIGAFCWLRCPSGSKAWRAMA